jgi:hypothetical protein
MLEKYLQRDYVTAVYKKSHHDVRPFLDAEMKKVDLHYLIMDASYKAAKKWRSTMVRPCTT